MNSVTFDFNTQTLLQKALPKAMSYVSYREMVAQLAKEGKSTGPEQTDALTNYTQLNDRRMNRWDKTLKFTPEAEAIIAQYAQQTTWLVLTESWCGDASPAIPVIQKIAELNENITLKIILRDENIAIMDLFLSNGNRSIPKLIAIDDQTGDVIGTWGPRSTNATKLVEDYKAQHDSLSAEFKQDLQVWYNNDKGNSILEDLTRLLLK
ncbi:MAG: thioredoxin family protein [Flavobacteriaceae bacterium]